jgi:uncharacterized OB-fold protein
MTSVDQMSETSTVIPHVDYLVLDDGDPHLNANECTSCGARYFDRRNACAGCFSTEFRPVRVATEGEVRAFTIVAYAAPGVPVPFVAAVVDCDGTSVRGNIINTEPDPDHIHTGMKVRLAIHSIGTDDNGVEAIGYGFEPSP